MKTPIGLKEGSRTAFAKMDTVFSKLNAVDLSCRLVDAMLEKNEVPVSLLQHVIWGMVVPEPHIYSIAREVVLGTKLNNSVEAHSVGRACATSLQSVTNAASFYHAFPEEKSVTLSGGAESFSSIKPVLTPEAARYFKSLTAKGSVLQKLQRLVCIPLTRLLPVPPSAREYSTGLTMGQHCELMIKDFKIDRARQDRLALRSHQNALKAQGIFSHQIVPVEGLKHDTLIRKDTSIEKLTRLSPVFDRKMGSITAGNASPFTDGAAGLYVISPKAETEVKPDARLVDFEYVGVDPAEGLLMGPGKAMLRILERQNLRWKDLDYLEVHEAFAGQVLCNVDAVTDPVKRQKRYGSTYDAGELCETTLNPWGSSIAYGHPFGATGARMLSQAIAYLKHHDKQKALVTACTAGGLAGACYICR